MALPRSAGILLHLTSLPGPYGIGELGDEAERFVDFLCAAGQRYWQLLPLGPPNGGCPYAASSSWAGSPWLVGLERLARAGDLTSGDLESACTPQERAVVDYAEIERQRGRLLTLAASRFLERTRQRPGEERMAFVRFCDAEAHWLEDWALFAALRSKFGKEAWWKWPRELARRESGALAAARASLARELAVERYIQFRFFEQLASLRAHAAGRGVALIGDLPIYAAADSADVWASASLFKLNSDGSPGARAGVPPDYFSQDGQLWGNPVYDWEQSRAQGYSWWIGRLKASLRQCDLLRIDHFRAFDSYWEVAPNASTAREGEWREGPGDSFFEAVRGALGALPFIAEDLGMITQSVLDLRDRWELPGMRVLQFAFGEGSASFHLPIHYPRNCVVYTGTHDNDTTAGWFASASERERDTFRRYTASDGSWVHHHAIRLAYSSVADLAIIPLQDVLGLGTEARMNVPGVVDGNWRWRATAAQLDPAHAQSLSELVDLFGRRSSGGTSA